MSHRFHYSIFPHPDNSSVCVSQEQYKVESRISNPFPSDQELTKELAENAESQFNVESWLERVSV